MELSCRAYPPGLEMSLCTERGLWCRAMPAWEMPYRSSCSLVQPLEVTREAPNVWWVLLPQKGSPQLTLCVCQ